MREYQLYEDEMAEFILKKYLINKQIQSEGNSIDDTIKLLDAHYRCEMGIAMINMGRESLGDCNA